MQYLCTGLKHGFDTKVNKLDLPTRECKNLLSAMKQPESVDELIRSETGKGFLKGPFESPPFDTYRVSPIGIAEGKYSKKKRLIVDLSSPHDDPLHESINDLIDKEQCSLTYVKIDDAIKIIRDYGKGAIMCKTDISDAFKLIPIHPSQWHLFCIKWRGYYYFYVRLCFGCRSSPKIFDTLSEAICWIALNNYNIKVILHLLDDFLTIDRPEADGDRTMALLSLIFNALRIPIAIHKTQGPAMVLEYLGIILDSWELSARLPQNKLERIARLIAELLKKKSCSKRELLQLLGHFNFAARVIMVGRSFVSYLIKLSTTVKELHHFVHLDANCRLDLNMWLQFLREWNGVSFFHDSHFTATESLLLFTDASLLGFGGYYNGHWFSSEWPTEYQESEQSTFSMAFRELYPIVVAAICWGNSWTSKKILFKCDNLATVHIINKGRSKCLKIMNLMRTLTWTAAVKNFYFRAEHLPGSTNIISDALSRFQMDRFRAAAPLADRFPTKCPTPLDVMWNSTTPL